MVTVTVSDDRDNISESPISRSSVVLCLRLPILLLPSFTHIHDLETEGSVISDCNGLIPTKSVRTFFKIVDTLSRQVYLYFLLYLAAMYFSPVSRIFEDAEVSKQGSGSDIDTR